MCYSYSAIKILATETYISCYNKGRDEFLNKLIEKSKNIIPLPKECNKEQSKKDILDCFHRYIDKLREEGVKLGEDTDSKKTQRTKKKSRKRKTKYAT